MEIGVKYHSKTYDSPNPVIRFAHRRRLATALDFVGTGHTGRLLDYGCGDGLFLHMFAAKAGNTQCTGFEPYMKAQDALDVRILRDWESVERDFAADKAQTVTCFEVFEHLDAGRQVEALRKIRSVLAPGGRLVLSVPIEAGIPSLPKNLFRWMKHGKTAPTLYNGRNFVKSLIGRPIPEHRTGRDYLSHMGFYYWELEKVLAEGFTIEQRKFSPFPQLGPQANSQVFYRLKPG